MSSWFICIVAHFESPSFIRPNGIILLYILLRRCAIFASGWLEPCAQLGSGKGEGRVEGQGDRNVP